MNAPPPLGLAEVVTVATDRKLVIPHLIRGCREEIATGHIPSFVPYYWIAIVCHCVIRGVSRLCLLGAICPPTHSDKKCAARWSVR